MATGASLSTRSLVQRRALAIAATDTDAGKTMLTLALAAYWQQYAPAGRRLGILKPVQAGVGDRERYLELFADLGQTPEQFNPLHFAAPLAPPLAAEREGRSVELGQAWQGFQALQAERDFVLVEGAGGLGTPITPEVTVAQLFYDWRLPTVLVVPVKLGAIGQAAAQAALAREVGLEVVGIVLNCAEARSPEEIAAWAPSQLLQATARLPVLGCLPWLGERAGERRALAAAAADLDLERLLSTLLPIG